MSIKSIKEALLLKQEIPQDAKSHLVAIMDSVESALGKSLSDVSTLDPDIEVKMSQVLGAVCEFAASGVLPLIAGLQYLPRKSADLLFLRVTAGSSKGATTAGQNLVDVRGGVKVDPTFGRIVDHLFKDTTSGNTPASIGLFLDRIQVKAKEFAYNLPTNLDVLVDLEAQGGIFPFQIYSLMAAYHSHVLATYMLQEYYRLGTGGNTGTTPISITTPTTADLAFTALEEFISKAEKAAVTANGRGGVTVVSLGSNFYPWILGSITDAFTGSGYDEIVAPTLLYTLPSGIKVIADPTQANNLLALLAGNSVYAKPGVIGVHIPLTPTEIFMPKMTVDYPFFAQNSVDVVAPNRVVRGVLS